MSSYLKYEYGTSNFIRKDPYLYQDMISMQCDSCQKLRISGKVQRGEKSAGNSAVFQLIACQLL